jgi:hypothetical protein
LAAQLAQLKRKTFSQLGECLGKFIPTEYLRPTASGPLSRRRVFSKENTFWAFFSQVLGADGGCQEVVRQLQAFAALKATVLPSSSTAAYCQARKKLTLPSLEAILHYTATWLQARRTSQTDRLHKGGIGNVPWGLLEGGATHFMGLDNSAGRIHQGVKPGNKGFLAK